MTALRFFFIILFVVAMPQILLAQSAGSPIQAYWEGTPGTSHLVIDFTNDPVVKELYRAGRLFEESIFTQVPVSLVYSSKTHRVYGRSFVCGELRDPCDISMTRTPEIDADGSVRPGLSPWALIGIVGGRNYGPSGPRHYGAGIEFLALNFSDGTVAMCLSTAPGVSGGTRYSGWNEDGQHLVCQILIMPNGNMVFGYNTDPDHRPRFYFQGKVLFDEEPGWFRGDAWSEIAGNPGTETIGRIFMKNMFNEKKGEKDREKDK